MKHWKKTWVALAALFALLLPPISVSAAEMGDPMRIGLYYGDTALPAANLENAEGQGYYLGYYNEEGQFFSLAWTGETQITMVKTRNMYLTSSGYSDSSTEGGLLGCYHIQLGTGYAGYHEVLALAEQYENAFPAWTNGAYSVRMGSYKSRADAEAAIAQLGLEGAVVGETSAYGINVVKTKTTKILFQFDHGEDFPLVVRPGLDPETKAATWFKGYKYYGDFRYERADGNDLSVVNVVDMEDYINCVISREMSESWPVEALKAQAICARNYAEQKRGRHKADDFDLCSNTHCQAYYGMGRTGENTAEAAAATNGIYAWYNGELAETYYFSSSGGATENPNTVWGGTKEYPYLTGVVDPYEATIADQIKSGAPGGGYTWSVTYTTDQLTELLRSKGYQCAEIVDLRISEFSPTGNVATLTFTDKEGKQYSFSREKVIRTWMGAYSVRYTISGGGEYFVNNDGSALSTMNGVFSIGADGTPTRIGIESMPYVITSQGAVQQLSAPGDTFTLHGAGWGHNVGMSQWGAHAMALLGKTYDEILRFYYTGIELY